MAVTRSRNGNHFSIYLISKFVIHYFTIAYIIIYNSFRNSESICMSSNSLFFFFVSFRLHVYTFVVCVCVYARKISL